MKLSSPLKKWIESANNAINGIIYAAKTERHIRYHFYAAIFILLTSFVLGVNRYEFLAIAIAVILVLLAEMMNSAIESVVDLLTKEYKESAKAAKDIAAGAVLVTASGSVAIGYIILLPYFKEIMNNGLKIATHPIEYIAVVAIVITIIIVIISKAYFQRGQPLRGGMPSGHTAIAFSIWTIVTVISRTFLSSFLVLALALIIAHTRVSSGIHRPIEVITGAALGIFITYTLLKLFT